MSIKLKDTIYDLINNADTLDGTHLSGIIQYYAPSSSNVLNLDDLKSTTGFQVTGWAYAGSPYVNSQPDGDGASSAATVIKFPGNYPFQIYRFYSSNDIKVRGYYSGTGWTSWSTILTSDNYTTYCAPASHSHNYASTVKVGSTSYSCSSNVISLPAYPTIPTSLKCPASLTIQLNGTSQGAWDGSADKTINITPASIGASTSHSHPYLPIAGGTLTLDSAGGLKIHRTDSNYPSIAFYNTDKKDYNYYGFNPSGDPVWFNHAGQVKKLWHEGNDGSGSGLDADTLDGVHLMGKGGNSGVMRSWARGSYTTSKQYFGNGNVVVIDPKPTDDTSLWANTTIFSVGDMEIRSHQLAFGYAEDKILYRRVSDGPIYNSWKTIAFTDSKVNNAGYADNSGQLNGYGEGNYYRQSRGALNNADINTFVKRNSGGYSINYSGYSGLLVSLQGNGGSTSSIEFIATHYDIKTGGLKVRYTIDSAWYGDTKSIAFLDSNVASASKLATARTISLTGSVTGSGSFDGSGNLSITTTTNHTHNYAASSSAGGSAHYLASHDTRSATINPDSFGPTFGCHFKSNGTNGVNDGGNYYGLIHFRPYGSSTDFSGGYPHQLAFTENNNIWYRKATSSTAWGTWRKIWHSGIFEPGNYMPKSGGAFTGSVTFANGTWNVVGDDAAIGDYNAAGMLGLKSCNNNIPGIGFHNSAGTLLGRLQSNGSTLQWNDQTIIHSGNIGSQSVNYANSAGNANTVDGYHIVVGSTGSDASTIYIIT